MDIQQTDKNSFKMAYWRLRCGQRESENGIEKLALAPLPIATSNLSLNISKFLKVNTQGLLEIRGQSASTGRNQIALWGIAFFLVITNLLWFFVPQAIWMMLPVFLLSIPLEIGIVWTLTTDSVESAKVNISPLFHSQKQKVLISWQSNIQLRPSLFGNISGRGVSKGSDWKIFCAFFGAMMLEAGWALLCSERTLPQAWLIATFGFILIGCVLLYFPIKPWIVYFFQSKKNPPQDHLAAIPWEEVSVEFHQLSAVSYVGPRSMYQLSIRCPLPDESERAFTIGLPVYSQQEAFCLYELIRDYMEHGAKGLEHTAAAELQTEAPDYGRVAYWREVKQHLKNPLTYPFWQLWSLISLRPFAHWYMEYLLDVLPKKNIHREAAIQWSQPIPESEWAKPSEQLQEANRRVRELYAKGLDWESPEVQAVLRAYERV